MSVLLLSVLGAVLVIAGVVIKNSEEQLNKSPSQIGPLLFLSGWAIFAYAVAHNQVNLGTPTPFPYIAAAAIAGAVMLMKKNNALKAQKQPVLIDMRILAASFIGGWLLLAYSIGRHSRIAGLSALLVLAAMMKVLPAQRKAGVVDGPGMPMFTAAWAGMIFANALQ